MDLLKITSNKKKISYLSLLEILYLSVTLIEIYVENILIIMKNERLIKKKQKYNPNPCDYVFIYVLSYQIFITFMTLLHNLETIKI